MDSEWYAVLLFYFELIVECNVIIGSGWTLLELHGVHLNLFRYQPLVGAGRSGVRGTTHLPIPKVSYDYTRIIYCFFCLSL